MPGRESHYPADWSRIAAKDLERARRRVEDGDIEDAGFRLQQAIEKYLKGWLLSRGWRLQRTHDLETLLEQAVRRRRSLSRYRALCRRVTGYYLIERYPTLAEGPAERDVRAALWLARQLVRDVLPRRKTRRS